MEYVPEKAEALITERTKAIMPVSLYGLSADLEAFEKIGKNMEYQSLMMQQKHLVQRVTVKT